ncbi:transposase [Nocardia sp. NPDC051981]|uniref:transposase n=1 Tax=Nocardia sp. NPDC051981 TaxID=3155417 RepID=UPI00342FD43E
MLRYEREQGEAPGATARVARDLGVDKEALRHWVKQAKASRASAGEVVPVPESTEAKDARIRELEARNRELERANQILKAASAMVDVRTRMLLPSYLRHQSGTQCRS